MTPRTCFALFAAVLLSSGTTGSGGGAQAQEKIMERTITVSASGQVSATPDQARVSSGVVTEAASAREALEKNSATMKKLIAGLKAAGVEDKDIQTSSFSVQPRYTNPREGQTPSINGYQVMNQVEILARDLSRLGETLDTMVSLGANQMHGLSFEVSQAETLKDDARKDAMANALRRAQLLAVAGGAEVGQVMSISEEVSGGEPRPVFYARAAQAEAVPVESGSQTLVARVTVTWRLK